MKFNWRKLIVIFLVVGALAAGGGYFTGNWLLDHMRAGALEDNAHRIKLAVESYAMAHDGSYPVEIDSLLTEGYLPQWPENPYSPTGEPMLPVVAGAIPQPGDFVYLPFGPVILIGLLDGSPVRDGDGNDAGPADTGTGQLDVAGDLTRREIDQYFLLFYGTRGNATFQRYSEEKLPDFERVAWDKVALVLTAGVPLEK